MTKNEKLTEIVTLVQELAHEVGLSNNFSGGVDAAAHTFQAGLEAGFDKNGKIDLKKVKAKLLAYKQSLIKAA